ncbi:hypothetical protein [Cryobacterium tepidiphilum]|uniref:LPXTG cell wall anchor domain-containing protein n=1 Tax=Cryobacterium tepidiphilum TaxID=2486026 RepID=A0A3M8KUM4_9MICO|nr:hypothetical protein [Cryobacterium tepidiphilum]RNE56389.1 hypothetical protein EEJ31_13665 [Cryobacterium tepidiphilum]
MIALTVLGGWLALPAYAEGASVLAPLVIEHPISPLPVISPQFVAGSGELLPDQLVAPQPEAVPPASSAGSLPLASAPITGSATTGAVSGTELADTGFHAIWLLPLAGGLILLGLLFAVFASRKQRRDEEQLVAEQAELARQAAFAEQADREALTELEELEKIDRSSQRPYEAPDLPATPAAPDARVHPVEPHGPGERVGPFVSLPDDRVGPVTGADSHEENGKRPDAP